MLQGPYAIDLRQRPLPFLLVASSQGVVVLVVVLIDVVVVLLMLPCMVAASESFQLVQ